jgi:hypothetical protein
VKEIYESELSSVGNYGLIENKLICYPNPVNDKLWIEFETEPLKSVQISLTDVWGSTLRTIKVPSSQNGKLEMEFPFGDLKAGIYFISVDDGVTLTSKKVVKL